MILKFSYFKVIIVLEITTSDERVIKFESNTLKNVSM